MTLKRPRLSERLAVAASSLFCGGAVLFCVPLPSLRFAGLRAAGAVAVFVVFWRLGHVWVALGRAWVGVGSLRSKSEKRGLGRLGRCFEN